MGDVGRLVRHRLGVASALSARRPGSAADQADGLAWMDAANRAVLQERKPIEPLARGILKNAASELFVPLMESEISETPSTEREEVTRGCWAHVGSLPAKRGTLRLAAEKRSAHREESVLDRDSPTCPPRHGASLPLAPDGSS